MYTLFEIVVRVAQAAEPEPVVIEVVEEIRRPVPKPAVEIVIAKPLPIDRTIDDPLEEFLPKVEHAADQKPF